MSMYQEIAKYKPKTVQERIDKDTILSFLENNKDAFYRTNKIAHMTSSAIITNKSFDKILFAYHNIYDSWAWVGGHNDGHENCLEVAIKEAKEETGLSHIQVLTDEIASIDVINVVNHLKNGEYVGDHLHLNVTYILIADNSDSITHKPDENSGVKWFDIDEVLHHVTEERIKVIYQKIFDIIKSQ